METRNGDEILSQPFNVGGQPRNLGPSGIYKGTLIVNFFAEDLAVDDRVTITGTGLRNCIVTHPSAANAHMECEIFKMPAGTIASAAFKVKARYNHAFDVVSAFAYINVVAATDPNLSTNTKRLFFYICSFDSTNPKCPSL
jgi:hypothetical protein